MIISTHAPRTGSDLGRQRKQLFAHGDFNPRSPHGERRESVPASAQPRHFNPRSPHGERPKHPDWVSCRCKFQPTLPARGATKHTANHPDSGTYFNPRSPHGERLFPLRCRSGRPDFNPRSPHGERRKLLLERVALRDFNPRSPHGERLADKPEKVNQFVFQPTLPARGATRRRRRKAHCRADFNPRSPHGERPRFVCSLRISFEFQPTLPARGATFCCTLFLRLTLFQPTLPARGATRPPLAPETRNRDFNPRSPHGERRKGGGIMQQLTQFQPTLPARGATSPPDRKR